MMNEVKNYILFFIVNCHSFDEKENPTTHMHIYILYLDLFYLLPTL